MIKCAVETCIKIIRYFEVFCAFLLWLWSCQVGMNHLHRDLRRNGIPPVQLFTHARMHRFMNLGRKTILIACPELCQLVKGFDSLSNDRQNRLTYANPWSPKHDTVRVILMCKIALLGLYLLWSIVNKHNVWCATILHFPISKSLVNPTQTENRVS